MRYKALLSASIGAIFGLLAATTVSAQEIPALADAKTDTERTRVQQLVETARKEGALQWIGVFIEPEHAEKVLAAFKTHYGLPDLRGEYVFVATGELITRVDRLLQAKSNTFDVVWTSSWAWYKDLLKRGEIMEYHSPYYADYTLSKAAGVTVDGYWVSDGYSTTPMFNPEALAKRGVKDFSPTSWKDLGDPRLKGLISIPDPLSSASAAQTFIGLAKVMGPEWIKAVADNKPVLRAKASQSTGWLATGEFPVTLGHAREAAPLREAKVPVELTFPEEGIVLQPFAPIILKAAPHPAAAQLFIDFVRSPKGTQVVMDSGAMMFFGRPGVKSPAPDLIPAWENTKVIPMDWDVEGDAQGVKNIRAAFRKAGLN
jgi:iron(III) transport system substrate-binding protein